MNLSDSIYPYWILQKADVANMKFKQTNKQMEMRSKLCFPFDFIRYLFFPSKKSLLFWKAKKEMRWLHFNEQKKNHSKNLNANNNWIFFTLHFNWSLNWPSGRTHQMQKINWSKCVVSKFKRKRREKKRICLRRC